MSSKPSSGNSSSAKSRWKLLASALVKSSTTRRKSLDNGSSSSSVIRYPAFDLVSLEEIAENDEDKEEHKDRKWVRVRCRGFPELDLKMSVLLPSTTTSKASTLIGFNNTGNVCVWPAEETLTIYALENKALFAGKSVLELGAGMTGMAGMILARLGAVRSVCITDGNELSVQNLSAIIEGNAMADVASASLLRWNSVPPALHSKFDVVICADCLFFDEFRADLKECFKSVLIPGGLGVITAPRRGKTFGDFKELLNSDPEFEILQDSEDYSERISAVRDRIKNDSNYDENVNYPRLLTFRKKEKPQTNSHL